MSAVRMNEPRAAVRPLVPLAQAVQRDDMRRLGTHRTQSIARAFNRGWRRSIEWRTQAYEERFTELLEGADGRAGAALELRDGFAIDRSGALPHLEALLEAGDELIERYSGTQWEPEKPFLQNINPETAIDEYPPLLDFATSAPMIATVAPSFGYVPPLSGLLPRGVRLMESSTTFDPDADGPWRESQLYHLDYHSTPTLYVVVALRDIAPEDGPLHFLGAAASRRVVEELGYGSRGVPYRLTDDVVNALVDESEVQVFAEPRGTVLFIESSACFHFGSRRPVNPRYQMQYGFVSPVRNDFLSMWRPQRLYPVSPGDPELRRMVLGRTRPAA